MEDRTMMDDTAQRHTSFSDIVAQLLAILPAAQRMSVSKVF